MPILGSTGLILAYLALALLLLSLHLFSNWSWWMKALATILLTGFYYVSYISVPLLLGWPTSYNLPKKFNLVAYSIAEKEGIYIWGFDLKQGLALGKPRSYQLPYSKELHNNIEIAGGKLKRGGSIIGEISFGPITTVGKTDNISGEQIRANQMSVEFIDTPEGLIPDKNQ